MKEYPEYRYHGIKKQFRIFNKVMEDQYPELSNEKDNWDVFQFFLVIFFLRTSKKQKEVMDGGVRFKRYPVLPLNSKILQRVLRYTYGSYSHQVIGYTKILWALYKCGTLTCINRKYKEGSISRMYQLNVRKMRYAGKSKNGPLKRMFEASKLKEEFPEIKKIQNVLLVSYASLEIEGYEGILKKMEEEKAAKQRKLIYKIRKGSVREDDIKFRKGRFYHPVQQLAPEIREHCLMTEDEEGELRGLGITDIPNCQAQLISDHIWEAYREGELDAPFDEVSDFKSYFKDHDVYDWLGSHLVDDRKREEMRDAGKDIFNVLVFGASGDRKVLRRRKRDVSQNPWFSDFRWRFEADPFAQVINIVRDRFPHIFRFLDKLDGNRVHMILTKREQKIRETLFEAADEQGLFLLDVHDEFLSDSPDVIDRLLEYQGIRLERENVSHVVDWHVRGMLSVERRKIVEEANKKMIDAIEVKNREARLACPERDWEDIVAMVEEENGY